MLQGVRVYDLLSGVLASPCRMVLGSSALPKKAPRIVT